MQPLFVIPYDQQHGPVQDPTLTSIRKRSPLPPRVYPQIGPKGTPGDPDLERYSARRYHKPSYNALVAQPDRASDYESEGRRFESCRARSQKTCKCGTFSCAEPRLHGALFALTAI